MININYQKVEIISDFCQKAFPAGKVIKTENGVFVVTEKINSQALEYLLNDLHCYYLPTNYIDGIRTTNFLPKLLRFENVNSCGMTSRLKYINIERDRKLKIIQKLNKIFEGKESCFYQELRQDLIRFSDKLIFAKKNNEHTICVSFKDKPYFRTNVGELTILWLPDFDLNSLQIKDSQGQRGEHRLWKPTPLQNVWYDLP